MKEFIKVIDENKDLILDAERYIWNNPESGYKEYKTNEYMIANFEKMGYKVNRVENVTGFYTETVKFNDDGTVSLCYKN